MAKPNNRCARCKRFTFSPAVVIGTQPFGRVCARKAGLIEPKRRRRTSGYSGVCGSAIGRITS